MSAPLRVLTWMPPDMTEHVSAVEGVELIQIPPRGPLDGDLEGDVLLVGARSVPVMEQALRSGVRWIHIYGTGVDGFPIELLEDGQLLTCSRGASGVPIAEWVLATILAFEKQLQETLVSEPWDRRRAPGLGTLEGKTLGLVGLGGIGVALAERTLPFGMRVLALRRHPRPSEVPGVEVASDLSELLAEADHLVLAAPATAATHHLIGRDALAQVKPGVHLVNVARGTLVDDDALRDALDDGRVALASLDTTEPEPLPEGHWMYTHPGVRLTPHISWSMPLARDLIVDVFVRNLRHYMAGEPLEGLVDVGEGY